MITDESKVKRIDVTAWESDIYGWDYTDDLGADTISVSDWTLESGSDATITDLEFTGAQTQVRFTGGSVGKHKVTNQMTTTAGAKYERTLIFNVVEYIYG